MGERVRGGGTGIEIEVVRCKYKGLRLVRGGVN